jgi:1,4-dihydroxy-2-naphthoyl-CoA hydrolase
MINKIKDIIKSSNQQTVFHALGIEIIKLDADETVVRMPIDERHYQHMGLVHGGIYVLLAESVASIAAACTLTQDDESLVALEINANHLKASREGVLFARSRALHCGSLTRVYEARVENLEGELVSMARCTLMALRKKPA